MAGLGLWANAHFLRTFRAGRATQIFVPHCPFLLASRDCRALRAENELLCFLLFFGNKGRSYRSVCAEVSSRSTVLCGYASLTGSTIVHVPCPSLYKSHLTIIPIKEMVIRPIAVLNVVHPRPTARCIFLGLYGWGNLLAFSFPYFLSSVQFRFGVSLCGEGHVVRVLKEAQPSTQELLLGLHQGLSGTPTGSFSSFARIALRCFPLSFSPLPPGHSPA